MSLMSSICYFKRLSSSLSQAVVFQTLTGFLTCCLMIWCMVIQCKMIELQHNFTQLERKESSQFTEIKSLQDLHQKSLSNLEAELQSLKLSTKNLAQFVEEQKSLIKTITGNQLQMHKDVTKCSEDLLNLHLLYAKHFTYPQACVDKAKKELKLHFEVERGKIFEKLYEEKLHNLHEIPEIHRTKYGSFRVVAHNSSNQHSSESLLTEKALMQMLNDLKRSFKQWVMTSKSTLHFLQGLIYQQVSDIAEVKLWTVRHIQQKFSHNKKFVDELNIHLKRNKKGLVDLNDTINNLKSSCCSYTSFAHRSGHIMKSKSSKEQIGLESSNHLDDGSWSHWDTIILIPILLTPIIYFLWANWSSESKEVVKKWTKESFYKEIKPTNPASKEKLENSLCVICFGSGPDNQKYVQLASDLLGPGSSLQMKKVLVNSTESLETIPPSKVILMFVDYNERNLIIEEEQGGLKRKTLTMLQRTGAEVTVVYCYELSSKHLDEGRLFAQKLTVVNRMKELRELRERDSIFSIYDKFNQTQKEVFRSKLNTSD